MQRFIFRYNAFTLAEIMVVLGVIGVLTCILLPAAFQATPDENVMKFKKAHNTLGTVIRELVTSDKYYKDGDLGTRANGNILDGKHDGDFTYYCVSIGEIVNAKKVYCVDTKTSVNLGHGATLSGATGSCTDEDIQAKIELTKQDMDSRCKTLQESYETGEIDLGQGIVIYEANPQQPYGVTYGGMHMLENDGDLGACTAAMNSAVCANQRRFFGYFDEAGPIHKDCYGFDRMYKLTCVDIDGKNQGEDPFGYGIRTDGKILTGARADEWLEKSLQGGD